MIALVCFTLATILFIGSVIPSFKEYNSAMTITAFVLLIGGWVGLALTYLIV